MTAEDQPGLLELGRRLRTRREEAGLDRGTLATQARISAEQLAAFEEGNAGLGVAELIRLAAALGVPSASFVHTRAPVVPAPVEPSVVLKAPGAAWLRDADRDALAAGLRRARAFTEIGELLGVPRLVDAFQPSGPAGRDAHVPGYDRARAARSSLLRSGALRSVARLLEDQFDILVLRWRFADPRVVGAACRTGRVRLVAVNTGLERETARRFALAHELGHQILDLDETGVLADELDTGIPWFQKPPREQRADAFAAMFLAPEEAVAELVGPPRVGVVYEGAKELVETVRSRLGVGFASVAWHLHNLRYYDRSVAETLRHAEPSGDAVTGFEEETRFDGLERRVLEAYARDLISRGRARELLGGVDPEMLGARG